MITTTGTEYFCLCDECGCNFTISPIHRRCKNTLIHKMVVGDWTADGYGKWYCKQCTDILGKENITKKFDFEKMIHKT